MCRSKTLYVHHRQCEDPPSAEICATTVGHIYIHKRTTLFRKTLETFFWTVVWLVFDCLCQSGNTPNTPTSRGHCFSNGSVAGVSMLHNLCWNSVILIAAVTRTKDCSSCIPAGKNCLWWTRTHYKKSRSLPSRPPQTVDPAHNWTIQERWQDHYGDHNVCRKSGAPANERTGDYVI